MASQFVDADPREFSIGRVFSRAFSTMGANPIAIFGIAFLFAALPQGLLGFALVNVRAQLMTTGGFGAVSLLTNGLTLVFVAIVQGGIVQATLAHAEGLEASIGACALTALRVSIPMLVLMILFSVACGISLVLLLVPGLMLLVIWSVAAPALVADRLGVFAAFGRSAELTRGVRWRVFGCGALFFVLYYIIGAAVGAATLSIFGLSGLFAAAATPGIGLTLFSIPFTTLLTAFWATTQSSLYVELRDWKDGPAAARLSEIFA